MSDGIDMGELVAALPLGVLAVDATDMVRFANPAAVTLLGGEARAIVGAPLGTALEHGGDRIDVERAVVGPPALELSALWLRPRDAGSDSRSRERLAAIGRMVAGFAHEVRNPLAGLQALGEALQAELDPTDSRRQYASRQLILLARLEQFIRAALEFAEPRTPRREAVALGPLLERAAGRAGERWPARPGIEVAPPRAPLAIAVDAAHAEACLRCLLDNACESVAGTAGVALAAAARVVDGRTVAALEVRDAGSGMTPDVLARACDPFFTTKPKALGLGLTLAETLATLNGGRLRLRSQPGLGTVATLYFELAP